MKKRIENYAFNKTTKKVTFSDYSSIRLDAVLLIVNVSDNVTIYLFTNPALGATVSGNELTLDYDTSAMSDNDELLIYYDDPEVSESNAENQQINIMLIEALNELVSRLGVLAGMANSGAPALRVMPIAAVSTPVTGSLTTLTTLTNLTNFGTGIPASEMAHDMNNMTAILGNINNVTP